MKNILFLSILLLGFIGCTKPYHYNGTELNNPKNLSIISYNENELQIVKIDGVKFKDKEKKDIFTPFGVKGMPFFIKSGKHKISSIIDWKDMYFAGNIGFSTSYKNFNIITICIDLKPQKEYYLYARKPKGENWKILVSDATNGLSFNFPDVKTIPCEEIKN